MTDCAVSLETTNWSLAGTPGTSTGVKNVREDVREFTGEIAMFPLFAADAGSELTSPEITRSSNNSARLAARARGAWVRGRRPAASWRLALSFLGMYTTS